MGPEQGEEEGDQRPAQPLYPRRQELDHQDLPVTIDDQAREEIGLAEDYPIGLGVGHASFPEVDGGLDPAAQEQFVDRFILPGQEADRDLRAGIDVPTPDEAAPGVADGYQFAGSWVSLYPLNLPLIDPGVSGHRASLLSFVQDDPRHRRTSRLVRATRRGAPP